MKMEMKKQYVSPKIKVCILDTCDIIATSGEFLEYGGQGEQGDYGDSKSTILDFYEE